MIIRNNLPALRAFRESRKTTSAMAKNLEKLSSGYRINRAGDDAAGLSISEKMRAQITELDRCQSNVSEGLNLAKTADGALQEVNDMLCRAQYLCVEAENGTYSEQELTAISDELNQLFGEIDRITASSKYNTIPLFRMKTSDMYRTIYNETIEGLAPDQLELWGAMEFVKDRDFDRAKPAQAAEAQFQLKDIKPGDPKDVLEDKFITIDNTTYHFTSTPTTYSSSNYDIDLSNYTTVKEALEKGLTNRYPCYLPKVSVSDDGTVTLKAPLKELTAPVNADGHLTNFKVPNGDGEYFNNKVVQNPQGTLGQVDNFGSTNNLAAYTVPTTKFSLSNLPDTLTANDLVKLEQSSIEIYAGDRSGDSNHYYSASIKLNTLGLTSGMTKAQVAQKLADAINDIKPPSNADLTCDASYNAADNCLDVTVKTKDFDGSNYVYTYIREIPGRDYDDAGSWTSKELPFDCTKVPGTMETSPVLRITVPTVPSGQPFSFAINSTRYLCHDPATDPRTTDGYPNTEYKENDSVYSYNVVETSDAQSAVIEKIKDYYSSRPNVEGVTVSGNVITITGMVSTTLENVVDSLETKVAPCKDNNMLNNNGFVYFDQVAEVSFDLGDDVRQLAGKGFSVEGRYVEFTNGPGTGVSSNYIDVDISKCTTAEDVTKAVKKAFPDPYKVAVDGNKLKISITNKTYNISYMPVTDGNDGIIAEGSVKFSGGTNATQSQAVLDFSSINSDNLDTLLGKGFRINCATCEGEYINIFFCWESDGTMPPEFQVPDPTTGEMRTIHNIPVELSKVTSGEKIVESIVNQVKPNLHHYTDLEIGEPPTRLIAKDKRTGDVTDGGKVYLGRMQSGLVTNFTYNVEVTKNVPNLPADGSVHLFAAEVNIYVGSDPTPQYIPVHLPYIDLEFLRLNPPKEVDLNAGNPDAATLLTKVKNADIAIADARGTIGADFNRLEHSFQILSKTEEEMTSSESLIRDTDMAELMMENTKLQILTQAQQTMMAQANTRVQNVLQLVS